MAAQLARRASKHGFVDNVKGKSRLPRLGRAWDLQLYSWTFPSSPTSALQAQMCGHVDLQNTDPVYLILLPNAPKPCFVLENVVMKTRRRQIPNVSHELEIYLDPEPWSLDSQSRDLSKWLSFPDIVPRILVRLEWNPPECFWFINTQHCSINYCLLSSCSIHFIFFLSWTSCY